MRNTLGNAGRILVFIAFAGCAGDAVADDNGWYVGAGLGHSEYGHRGVLYYGDMKLDAKAEDDGRGTLTAMSFALGYRLNRYVSIEAGHLLTEATTFTLTDADNRVFGRYGFNTDGATLAVVGMLPLGNWELHARAGALYAKTQVDLFTDSGLLFRRSERSTELLTGIGAAYNFTDHWQAKLDGVFIPDVGERHETGATNIGSVTLGFTYRF